MRFTLKTKKIVMILLALFIITGTFNQKDSFAAPSTGKTWLYLNYTALLSPNWAFVIMPGHRYEYYNNAGDASKTFLYELFAGPVYIKKLSPNLTLKLPLWYYYMGFDFGNASGAASVFGTWADSHNFEIIPTLVYKTGKFAFTFRKILHNKFYADNKMYTKSSERFGYSLLMREMIHISYAINKTVGVFIADEVFFGVAQDITANSVGEPAFEKLGFSRNRLYIGGWYKITPMLKIAPQYIFERDYNTTTYVETKDSHYIQATLSYVMKFF